MAMGRRVDDLAGNNLERWGVTTPVSSLKFIKEVPVSGGVLDEVFFGSTKIRLKIKGYFQEEFLCKMGSVCIPPAKMRAYQIVRHANNKNIFREISPELIVVNPVHFLGYLAYVQVLSETFFGISVYDTPEVIALAIGAHRKVNLMRAVLSGSLWNLYAEDAHNLHVWRMGTHVVSRGL